MHTLADSEASRSKRQDAYLWRFCATLLSYGMFGLGGLVLGLLVFPVMQCLPSTPDVRRRRARRILQVALRTLISAMRRMGALTYDVQGAERLGRPGQMIVANHPSLIDVVFLIAFSPGAGCVVKQSMWRNPVTRGTALAAAYVPNQPTDAMIDLATQALESQQSVIIFPEGTRTIPGQPLRFHRGAASIAVKAATIVTPVFIRCEPTTLTKSTPWYRIPDRRVHISMHVGEDIDPAPFRGSAIPLASRTFNSHLLGVITAGLVTRERTAP